jgi:hypothetical protein
VVGHKPSIDKGRHSCLLSSAAPRPAVPLIL